MQIQEIEIEKLIPYEFNNKIHDETQVNRIANSIKEFWFKNPILIDKNNIIIAWHWRLEWAKKLWLKKVPCIVADDLSEEQVRKFRILDNRLNESERDVENLQIELSTLSDLNIWDLEINIDDEFGDLFPEEESEEKELEEDEAPAVSQKAKAVEYWDIFQLWNHRLMCWDSTKIENCDELMNWELADMLFTDPPYWMCLDTDRSSAKSKDKFYQEKKCKWQWNKYDRIIWDNEDFKDALIDTIFDNFWYVKEIFIRWWDYFPELLRWYKDWNYFVRDKRSNEWTKEEYIEQTDKMYWSQFEICRSKQKHRKEIARVKRAWIFWTETEFDKSRVHPTQKPTNLASRFLKRFSKEWEKIVDLYWWSWSTLIACEQLNRKCYMMELDPKYIEVIIKRFHKINPDAEIKCVNREININEILSDEK